MLKFLYWKWVKGYCRHFCILCKWRRQCKLDRDTDKYIESVFEKARNKRTQCFISEVCYDCTEPYECHYLDSFICSNISGLCKDCLRYDNCEMGDK